MQQDHVYDTLSYHVFCKVKSYGISDFSLLFGTFLVTLAKVFEILFFASDGVQIWLCTHHIELCDADLNDQTN